MAASSVASQIATRDFGKHAVSKLAKAGIRFVGTTVIPSDGPMPFAHGDRGYCIDDNGTHRVKSYREILALV